MDSIRKLTYRQLCQRAKRCLAACYNESMQRARISAAAVSLTLWLNSGAAVEAGTIVLANRTTDTVVCNLGNQDCKLLSGQVLPVRANGSLTVRFAGSVRSSYALDPNAIYFLAPDPPGRVDLVRIGLGGDATSSSIFESDRVFQVGQKSRRAPDKALPLTIPVKLLYDDDEPAANDVAERRLVQRLKAASEIFERHCFVRFEPVAVATWDSDDATTDFELSLADFERQVPADPARLAIGFTSQYRLSLGRTHLGGTRGPMHSHLLVREWSQRISEPERLEVLVHELGHFLGAVHSPEPDSVMRAVLGDRLARAANFRIGFDPVNTLAMCLVSEEMQSRKVVSFGQMSFATQLELHKLYEEVAPTDSNDGTPAQYVAILEQSLGPIVRGTRQVLIEIGFAAQRNAHVAAAERVSGDELTDYYVRSAAEVARKLPPQVGPRAFLLGLGAGLDRTSALAQHRLIGPLFQEIESASERIARIEALGVPTARGRHELARHFALSAALSGVVGYDEAERACLALQLGPRSHPGAFSVQAYQADLAGIVFAHHLLAKALSLDDLSKRFAMNDFLPRHDEAAALTPDAFAKQFGDASSPQFRRLRNALARPLRAANPIAGGDQRADAAAN
jgi:hypothetical protein